MDSCIHSEISSEKSVLPHSPLKVLSNHKTLLSFSLLSLWLLTLNGYSTLINFIRYFYYLLRKYLLFYNICSKTRNHFSLEKYSAHFLRLCKYYSNEFENQLHMYMYLRFLAPKVFQISLRSWNIHIHVINYFEDRITPKLKHQVHFCTHTHTYTYLCVQPKGDFHSIFSMPTFLCELSRVVSCGGFHMCC